MGLHKSVTYRLVRSLENAGVICRDPAVGGYRVGSALLSMSVSISSRVDVRRVSRPYMEQIVRRFGETASLHVRNEDQRVCVESVEGWHPIRRVIPIGETHPVYAGETGRILLTGVGEAELQRQLDLASQNGLDAMGLREEVARARQQGWIIGIGLRTPDVGSVSLALRGPDSLLGALTISGPASRWNASAMEEALPVLVDAAAKISDESGYRVA